MSEEHKGSADLPEQAETGSRDHSDDLLSETEKERIRSEEMRAAEERRYREEVRREVRREVRGDSTWARVRAMLKLEPGISEEIASDPRSAKQGLIVFAIAAVAGGIWFLPLLLITIPATLVALAVAAGLYWLFSRLFTNEVPAYANWYRTLLFASAPTTLAIVPILGAVIGNIYMIVLHVIAIRDLARISNGQAIVVLVVTVLLPMLLVLAAVLVVGAAAFLEYLPDVFHL